MAAILPGYEYDIFISYRQNDNKRDGWVTSFVDALKDELEATLKNPVSIYFDVNPHDGLLESHQVGASLEKKLKCLVFIPIISQTYCDTQSFAWQHEFLPFNKMATEDRIGMNITLAGGNVASRVLPIKIHDIDAEDQQTLEKELGGPLRSIDFIYKESGVNRSLKPSDERKLNLEKTDYHNQINKVANALKDIGNSLIKPISNEAAPSNPTASDDAENSPIVKKGLPVTAIAISITVALALLLSYLFYFRTDDNSTSPVLSEDPEIRAIAVLPFSNNKPSPESDYLGFAIANQIIGQLDYNKNLIVRPSSAIRKYDQTDYDASVVGTDLKVNYVLAGSYLKVNDIIRLSIELVDAATNNGIWRDEIEVDFKNAFDLQDLVAQKVSDRLNIQFSSTELNIVSLDVPSNPQAYDYYLRSLSYPPSVEGCLNAIEMLKKSIVLDSTYAPAYVEFGTRSNYLQLYGTLAQRQPKRPIYYYQKALALNGNQLDALISMAARYTEIGRIDEAVKTIKKALQLNPNNAHAHFYLGYIYRYAGFIPESIEEMEIALNLYPANTDFRSIGISYILAGNDEKALNAFTLDKGSIWEMGWQILIYYRQGNFDKVSTIAEKIIDRTPDGVWAMVAQVYISSIEGNPQAGSANLRELELLNIDSNGGIIDGESSFLNALYYQVIGDDEGTLRCLKRAVDNGYFNYPYLLNAAELAHLNDNEDYKKIQSSAKAKHEAFKKKFLE